MLEGPVCILVVLRVHCEEERGKIQKFVLKPLALGDRRPNHSVSVAHTQRLLPLLLAIPLLFLELCPESTANVGEPRSSASSQETEVRSDARGGWPQCCCRSCFHCYCYGSAHHASGLSACESRRISLRLGGHTTTWLKGSHGRRKRARKRGSYRT
ncbi:hypothetical protein BC827DRAFT_971630 [Russula dissimulans]|nr:hypothetical protein BC827DRAFT_971630 [Russula dissimulans]